MVLPSWASCHFCSHRFPDVSAALTLAQQREGLLRSGSVPGSGSWGSIRRGPPDSVTPPRRPCPLTFGMCGVTWMLSTGLTDDRDSREAVPLGEFLWLGGQDTSADQVSFLKVPADRGELIPSHGYPLSEEPMEEHGLGVL